MKCAAIFSAVLFVALSSSANPQNDVILRGGGTLASNLQASTVSTLCPNDMVEIEGDFCPDVVQNCLKLDMSVHNVNGYVRCLEFAPTKCQTPDNKRVHMHYCMDRYEWPNKLGAKPALMVSWNDMKKNCQDEGRRLCVDHEWALACEGPEILPYPYGYKRDTTKCNIDHPQRPWFDAVHTPLTPENVARLDQSVPSGSMPECVSPYGVYDMTRNIDEWVINSYHSPYDSGLMGGHWVVGARNRCRPETMAHGPDTVFYPIGGRCCQTIH